MPFAPSTSFAIRRVYFHYRMTFAAYIWCFFVHNFHLTMWPWPSTFWPWHVWWIQLHTTNAHTNFSILRLSVPELWVTQSDHITITSNGHCACAVSRDLSPGEWFTFLKSLTTLLIHLLLSGHTTKIKPCDRRKIAFSPLWGYKVHCAFAVSHDLCI